MSPGIRLLVTGYRNFPEGSWWFVHEKLDKAHAEWGVDLLIVGDCPTGVDRMARSWAGLREVEALVLEADWTKHGRAAGPRRNQRMVDEGQPDAALGIIVPWLTGGRGTRDCLRRARAAGIDVYVARLPEPQSEALTPTRSRSSMISTTAATMT